MKENSWELRFTELVAFKRKHGHCRVPQGYSQNQSLATWVSTQRRSDSKLSAERLSRLTKLGFSWDPFSDLSNLHFSELKAFKKKHGHCNVPHKYTKNRALGTWVANQRMKKGELTRENLARLKTVGFDFDPFATQWDIRFSELRIFKREHGHCNVPQRYNKNPNLAAWVANQRKTKSKISPARLARLEKLGFNFRPRATLWELRFAELEVFKEKHGHCRVPQSYPKNHALATWVSDQRERRKTLSPARLFCLKKLGFDFSPLSTIWEQRFSELMDFKRRHGHCNVHLRYSKNPELGAWVSTQRQQQSKLSVPRRTRLVGIGFDFNRFSSLWDFRLKELKAFKKANGHCNVPNKYSKNSSLGLWVGTQRREQSKLSLKCLAQLERLGFDFDPFTTLWELRFSELVAFKKKHGHSQVPQRNIMSRALGVWVNTQRFNKRRSMLSAERQARLTAIGFDFEPLLTAWDKMFQNLVVFKRKHGHCRVPHDTANYELWWWLTHQLEYKARLSQKQITRLREVGVAIESGRRIRA